jgi:nucleoid-associated protein YgaU
MERRTSVPARVLAAATLAVAFVVAIAIIGGALGGDSGHHGHHKHANGQASAERKKVPATYVVQSGDTLIAIAHRTGVPVVRIEALNPQVDPQILIAGEELKLR